jgi:hypothetical protein
MTEPYVSAFGAGEPDATADQPAMQLLDTRSLAKPEIYKGEQGKWVQWSFVFRSYVACVNRRLGKLMKKSEEENQNLAVNNMNESEKIMAENLFLILTMTTREMALLEVMKVEEGNGFAAWRALVRKYEPRNAVRHMTMLKKLMAPQFGADAEEFMVKLTEWELAVSRYEQSSSSKLGDDTKRAIVMAHAPQFIAEVLQNNSGSYFDYEEMKEKIEELTMARRDWSRAEADDGGVQPMTIGYVGKNGWQKGKKGKDKGKGKGWQDGKGKGQWKGNDNNQQQWQSKGGKGKGKGKQGKQQSKQLASKATAHRALSGATRLVIAGAILPMLVVKVARV